MKVLDQNENLDFRPPIADENSFKELLRKRLAVRVAENANYSLRLFALDLGVHFATLSHIISGKRIITPKSIRIIGPRLGLSQHEIEKYIKLYTLEKLRWNRLSQVSEVKILIRSSDVMKIRKKLEDFNTEILQYKVDNVDEKDCVVAHIAFHCLPLEIEN